jgi:hypothetical protein
MSRQEQGFPCWRVLTKHISVNNVHVTPEHGIYTVAASAVFASPVFSSFLASGRGEGKDGGIVEVSLSAHDTVGTSSFEAGGYIVVAQDVSIGEHDSVCGEIFPQVTQDRPVGQARVVSLLVALAAMDGDDAGACRQNHLCVVEGLFRGFEDAHLRSDGDVEISVEVVDELVDEVPVFLQKGTVVAFASDALGTAEVEVDSIAEGLDMTSSGEQVVGVVGAELDKQRTVGFVVAVKMAVGLVESGVVVGEGCFGHRGLQRLEVGFAVFGVLMEQAGVEHGRVGKQLLVLLSGEERARQQAPGLSVLSALLHLCMRTQTWPTYKLALLDHGRQDQLGAANALVESPPMQLCRLCRLTHPCRLCLDCVRERERRCAQYCWPKQSCQEHGPLDSCTSIRTCPSHKFPPHANHTTGAPHGPVSVDLQTLNPDFVNLLP